MTSSPPESSAPNRAVPGVEDRLEGALLGLALGDALGFVVEAEPPEIAAAYVDEWLRAGRAGGRAHPRFPFGQYSDDTQLARALLLGVRDAGGWDPAAFATRIAELFRQGREVGAGAGTRAAARRLIDGARWDEAGTPAPYAGNGSAMRVAPLGVLFATDLGWLRSVAASQSRITHQDPRCARASVAVAGAAALALRPGPLDRLAFLAELAELVAPEEQRDGGVVRGLAGWVALSPGAAAAHVRASRRWIRRMPTTVAGYLRLRPAQRGVEPLRLSPHARRLLGDGLHGDRGRRRYRHDGGHGRGSAGARLGAARLTRGLLARLDRSGRMGRRPSLAPWRATARRFATGDPAVFTPSRRWW